MRYFWILMLMFVGFTTGLGRDLKNVYVKVEVEVASDRDKVKTPSDHKAESNDLNSESNRENQNSLPDNTTTSESQFTGGEEIIIAEEGLGLVYPKYQPWESVAIDGKLKMEGLPLSPNLKIYMEKDSLILISVRAPLIGEAGRLIVTPDSVTAINKINKTFTKEYIKNYMKYYPGGLSDLQSLLLGHFFMPGIDLGTRDIEDLIDVFPEDDQFNIIPKGDAVIEGVKYGYVVDSKFRPLMIVVMPAERPNLEIDVLYKYNLKGYDLQMVMQDGEGMREATLELKEPNYGVKEPKDINLGKKYRQVSLGDFFRNLGR